MVAQPKQVVGAESREWLDWKSYLKAKQAFPETARSVCGT
jgi:hypothetical protein